MDTHAAMLRLDVGAEIGPSAWIAITQTMIDGFGASTLDPDPMHIDPEWAAKHSPYGTTIAFGFLTMGLLTHLLHNATSTSVHTNPETLGVFLNYGFDRVRLIAPVPVGSRVRGKFVFAGASPDGKGRILARFACTVEIEGSEKPALVGEWLSLWLPPAA
jgi:acyl dehydratase